MKIAILNRDRSSHPGGDLIQIDHTIAALAKLGVQAVYLPEGWQPADLASFDLCHLFHCQFGWCWRDRRKISEANRKYVITPIFYPNHWEITKEQVQIILGEARQVLPFSTHEGLEIMGAYDIKMQSGEDLPRYMTPIPNGTDPAFHAPNATMDREGVLCVSARGDNDKNTDRVERICKDLGIPFTLACGVPHAEMPAVYRKHRVFVNASDSERMSLTIGEALCAGCRVLATVHNRGNEWYGRGLNIIDPDNKKQIARMISWAHGTEIDYHDDYPFRYSANDAARRLTWDAVAAQLFKVYQQALR